MRADINNNVEVATFGQLCDRYLKEGVSERHATASALRSMIRYRIRPYWCTERVSDMAHNPMAVEQWIKALMTTPGRRKTSHIRWLLNPRRIRKPSSIVCLSAPCAGAIWRSSAIRCHFLNCGDRQRGHARSFLSPRSNTRTCCSGSHSIAG